MVLCVESAVDAGGELPLRDLFSTAALSRAGSLVANKRRSSLVQGTFAAGNCLEAPATTASAILLLPDAAQPQSESRYPRLCCLLPVRHRPNQWLECCLEFGSCQVTHNFGLSSLPVCLHLTFASEVRNSE